VLEHLNHTPVPPKRVVVMGAGGFVGGAVAAWLRTAGAPVLALARADVDLLSPGAEGRLAALIEPGDAFVAVSARAPAKDADMMIENLIMARAMVRAEICPMGMKSRGWNPTSRTAGCSTWFPTVVTITV